MSAPDLATVRDVFGELAEQPRWVCWRLAERKGKRTKVPLKPGGSYAKTDTPATWTTLARCAAYAEATPGVGVGIVFNGDGLVGVDLDDCRDDATGELADDARRTVAELASYAEVTPSGRGLHILCRGRLPNGASGTRRGNVEVYATGRFFTVTGAHLAETPDEIADAEEALERLWSRLGAHEPQQATGEGASEVYQAAAGPDTPWRRLNTAALAKLGAWVPELFGDAAKFVKGKGGYRIGAAALGRDLEEDLSIMPHGIRDWGMGDLGADGCDGGREGKRTPLDLVLEFGGAPDELRAAEWLAEKLGKRLDEFGFKNAPPKRRMNGAPAVEPEPHGENATKGVIRLTAGDLHRHVAASADALAELGNVYRRGSVLVRVGRLATGLDQRGVRQAAGSLAILTYEPDGLLVPLSEAAKFERFDGRSESWRTCDPPAGLARAILASPDRWSSIPDLLGIVEAPTLRPDGSLLDQPGYDPASGIYLDTAGAAFPPVPSHPSRAEAEAALAKLAEILAGFPFVDDAARAVAVSAILTTLVRRALRAAPMVVLTAPKMGSGKTLLSAICSYVATGRPAAVMTQDADPVSERKRLLSLLMSGASVAVIDNIERPLKSAAMCSILTEPEYQDRLLGVSQQVSVPTNIFWLATGNNVTIEGDLTTRVLVAAIDPACERPEERSFAIDLHHEVPRRRGELAAAALTVIRAYLAAGEPDLGLPPFGRFEQWQRWCRFPLVWLGMADPCATRRSVETRDPEREKLTPLLAAWRDAFGNEAVTCRDAISRANTAVAGSSLVKDEPGKALHVAIEAAAVNRGTLDGRRLGRFIAGHERRVEGGLRFERDSDTAFGVRWRAGSGRQGYEGNKGFSHTPYAKCQAHTSDSLHGQCDTNSQNPRNPQPRSSPAEPHTRDTGPLGKCRSCVFTAPLNEDGQCGACAHERPQPRPKAGAASEVTP